MCRESSRRWPAIVAIALLVPGLACSTSKSSTAPTPTRGTLSGLVTEQGTLAAAPGARVDVVDGSNQGRSAQADGTGRYQLADLDTGTFTIRASASGFDAVSRSVTLAASLTSDFALRRTQAGAGFGGRAVDAVSDRPLSNVTVRLDGLGDTTTDADGRFRFDASGSVQSRLVTVTSNSTIERQTHVRVPGADVALSLMPASLNQAAFAEMFRNGGYLRRWTAAPRLVIQRRVLQYTNLSDDRYVASATLMTEAEANDLIADLTWALPQFTGGLFSAFVDPRIETAAEGEAVSVNRSGTILVARYQGLTNGSGFWGYTRWSWNGAGELLQANLMLDNTFETSGSPFRRSLRSHELGHAMSYTHVTTLTSVMNSNGRVEPTAFDRDGAKVVFQRPTMNRAPDVDPDPYTINRQLLAQETYSDGMP